MLPAIGAAKENDGLSPARLLQPSKGEQAVTLPKLLSGPLAQPSRPDQRPRLKVKGRASKCRRQNRSPPLCDGRVAVKGGAESGGRDKLDRCRGFDLHGRKIKAEAAAAPWPPRVPDESQLDLLPLLGTTLPPPIDEGSSEGAPTSSGDIRCKEPPSPPPPPQETELIPAKAQPGLAAAASAAGGARRGPGQNARQRHPKGEGTEQPSSHIPEEEPAFPAVGAGRCSPSSRTSPARSSPTFGKQNHGDAIAKDSLYRVFSSVVGILSQLRWEGSKCGKFVSGVQEIIPDGVKSRQSPVPSTKAFASDATDTRKGKAIRQFRKELGEGLQACSSHAEVERLLGDIGEAICGSSPGVSGGFVVLKLSIQQRFFEVLQEEAERRLAELMPPTDTREPIDQRRASRMTMALLGFDPRKNGASIMKQRQSILALGGDVVSIVYGDDPGFRKRKSMVPTLMSALALKALGGDEEAAQKRGKKRSPNRKQQLTGFRKRWELQKTNTFMKKEEEFSPLFQSKRTTMFLNVPVEHAVEKNRILEAFQRLQDDNHVHKDDLHKLLELLGYVKPSGKLVDQAHRSVCKWVNISKEDFFNFVEAYEYLHRDAMASKFEQLDASKDGNLSKKELGELLSSFGIEPMAHVLDELVHEVNRTGADEVNFSQFNQLVDILHVREGFTRAEYAMFRGAFFRYDRDKSGEIDTQELAGLINYLCFPVDVAVIQQCTDEVDLDHNGHINENEFLVFMRKLTDRLLPKLKTIMNKFDSDGSGHLSKDELISVFKFMGYLTDADSVEDAANDAGIDLEGKELDLSETWRLMDVFRRREGLNATEAEDVKAAFMRHASDETDEISTLEVGQALAHLGCHLPYEVRQDLIAQVDVDDSGNVDLPEMLKLVRMCNEIEMQQAMEILMREGGQDGLQSEWLERGSISAVAFDSTTLVAMSDKQEANLRLVQHMNRFHKMSRCKCKERSGFSFAQYQDLQSRFRSKTGFNDDRGEIPTNDLVEIIGKVFPSLADDLAQRQRLKKLIADASHGSSEFIQRTCDFSEFIQLMATLREVADSDKLAKERAAVKECGFSRLEVKEFRQLFLSAQSTTNTDSELNMDEAMKMLEGITPLGHKNTAEFIKIFSECASQDGTGGRPSLDFPGFLRLMHKLLEVDFAQINERTSHYEKRLGTFEY